MLVTFSSVISCSKCE